MAVKIDQRKPNRSAILCRISWQNGAINCQEEDMLLLIIGVEPSLLSATLSNLENMKARLLINPFSHPVGYKWLVLAVLFSARRFSKHSGGSGNPCSNVSVSLLRLAFIQVIPVAAADFIIVRKYIIEFSLEWYKFRGNVRAT